MVLPARHLYAFTSPIIQRDLAPAPIVEPPEIPLPPIASTRTGGALTPDPERMAAQARAREVDAAREQLRAAAVSDFRQQLVTHARAHVATVRSVVLSEVDRIVRSGDFRAFREAAAMDQALADREAALEGSLITASRGSVGSRGGIDAHYAANRAQIIGDLQAQLDEARGARVLLRAANPALAVYESPHDINLSATDMWLALRLGSNARAFAESIDDVEARILSGDIPLHALDRLVAQVIEASGVDPERGDDRSDAIHEWLSDQTAKHKLISIGSAAASLFFGILAMAFTGGAAIFVGAAGSAIGIGGSAYEYELAADLVAMSRISVSEEDGLTDPRAARQAYAMAIAGAVLGAVDLLLVGRAAKAALQTEKALGAIPAAQVARVERLVGKEAIDHAVEVFGLEKCRAFFAGRPNAVVMQELKVALATPARRAALAAARAEDIFARLKRGAQGAQLGDILHAAESLHPNVRLAEHLGRYFAGLSRKQLARELDYAKKALRLEALDHGHSIVRHGPQVPDVLLERRPKTGMAPDDLIKKSRHSTRAASFESWYVTRQRAIVVLGEKQGVDLAKPPPVTWQARIAEARADVLADDPNAKYFEVSEVILIDHLNQVPTGTGFTGRAGSKNVSSGNWTTVDPVSGLYRSHTRFTWTARIDDPMSGEWNITQHFPTADKFDPGTTRYTTAADKTYSGAAQ